MKKLKIEITDDVKQVLIQEGVEELEGRDNWLDYMNKSFLRYLSDESMRETYRDQKRLNRLQEMKEKTVIELQEEEALQNKLNSENVGKKLRRVYDDRMFFIQRTFLVSESENQLQNTEPKKTFWSLWMRNADFLNAKLVSIGELPICDKSVLKDVQDACATFVFDHPQQLIADLAFLSDMQNELRLGMKSISYLKTPEALIYRKELNRVYDVIDSEKSKIEKTLHKIKKSMLEGNNFNIAHQMQIKINTEFEKAHLVKREKWGEKELATLDEVKNLSEKVFPTRIMKKPVYGVKDFVDICDTVSPKEGFVLKGNYPIEIERVPHTKSVFFSLFNLGKNALFDLFSNKSFDDLNRAYQDLHALYELSVKNIDLVDDIVKELSNYYEKFKQKLEQHKVHVEEKLKSLNANFLSRFIAEKECRELENWLSALDRYAIQAGDISQSICSSAMHPIPKTREDLLEEQKKEIEKNQLLGQETQILLENGERLRISYIQTLGIPENATNKVAELTRPIELQINSNDKLNDEVPPPKPAKRIPKNAARFLNVIPEERLNKTPQQKREDVLKECAQSQAMNEQLAQESESLANNLQVLKQKRKTLLSDSLDSSQQTEDQIQPQQESHQKKKNHGQLNAYHPNTKVFTNEFSKTLALACVTRGQGMKLKQKNVVPINEESVSMDKAQERSSVYSSTLTQ